MKRDAWRTVGVFVVALAVRAIMVAWAHDRFPPSADGVYYERFADRLASGLGYTTAWPDGAVTYAAHYPVGYPWLVSLAYRLLGHTATVAMGLNALIGAVAAACAHRIALREVTSGLAVGAGLLLAVHPALVLYTPAPMTEGVAAALAVIAVACAPRPSSRHPTPRLVAMGVLFGVATLVRPQLIAVAPVFAWVFTRRLRAVALVLAVALATVAPWTARNCVRMHRCALVSVNGGWNLLIGTATANGGWTELTTPPECATVWDEAEKDVCFERAARTKILTDPIGWIARAPRKLGATFDFFVAGPAYLYRSNPKLLPYRTMLRMVIADVLASRLLLVAALAATMPIWRLRVRGYTPPRKRALPGGRILVAIAGAVCASSRVAWIGYLLLAILCLVADRRTERRSAIRLGTGLMILATMATHAVFFGAGRYGLLVVPWVTLTAFACVRPKALSASDLVDARQVIAGSHNEREESPSSKEYGAG